MSLPASGGRVLGQFTFREATKKLVTQTHDFNNNNDMVDTKLSVGFATNRPNSAPTDKHTHAHNI